MLSILFISPVTTWADTCPEGEKWNDREGECIKSVGPTKRSKQSRTSSTAFDGEYAVDIRCSWGSINTINMNCRLIA